MTGGLTALSRTRAALLVVDIQDRLVPAMPADAYAALVRNTQILIQAADRLGLPIVVSEQYPKGLGATAPAIAAELKAMMASSSVSSRAAS